MDFQRSSGVLLHVSSLPSYGGIGDLGPAAHEFLSFLAEAKQHVWQVLPLCPTGYGNSPYAGSSAFAGNPYLISLEYVSDWGWIDGQRKGFDDKSFLQRYTPRTRKSIWSQINVDNVARLIKEGRMTEYGLKEVDRAKADGRWTRAYKSGKDMKIPDDLQAAIDAEPKAKAMLAKLSAQNRFALAFRMHNMKTEAGRTKKIEAMVAMLKRGETIYPQGEK